MKYAHDEWLVIKTAELIILTKDLQEKNADLKKKLEASQAQVVELASKLGDQNPKEGWDDAVQEGEGQGP